MKRHKLMIAGMPAALAGLVLAACHPNPEALKPSTQVASSISVESSTVDYDKGQNWSPQERDEFHYTSQGSELIPYYWFLSLQAPDGAGLFVDGMKKYGFLYEPASSDPKHLNPDHLPIGFAKGNTSETINALKETHWVGLTCAACHTGAVNFKATPTATTETTLIVDGAPTSADLGAFLLDLAAAVQATNAQPKALTQFAANVAKTEHGTSAAEVEAKFKIFAGQFSKIVKCATPTNPWGPGRVDAFGVIFNRACDFDLLNTVTTHPPDAPVSYPFLWYSGRQDHIQWHGEVDNHDWVHRLARNTGEVTGVFARVDVKPGDVAYKSSVSPTGLGKLDRYVENLRAPTWPAAFGTPKDTDVSAGSKLFHDNCSAHGCHADVAGPYGALTAIRPIPLSIRDATGKIVPALNTDDTMTMLVHTRMSQTGGLANKPLFLFPIKSLGRFPAAGIEAPAGEIVGNVGAGELVGKAAETGVAYVSYLLNSDRHKHEMQAKGKPNTPTAAALQAKSEVTPTTLATAYKVTDKSVSGATTDNPADPTKIGYEARPLSGIWATAPYLHNGSVPNLAQLLRLKPRDAKFYVGSLAYNIEDVGFVSDGSKGGVLFDTNLPGNHNTGHEYGINLSEAEKRAIIEYLKSL